MTAESMALNRMSAVAAALVLLCSPLRAANDDACYVPPFLVEPQNALHRVAEAVKRDNKLSIAIVSGSPSQVGGTKGRRSYPSYLEAALKKRVPDIEVKIDVRAKARRPASELLKLLPAVAEEAAPSLVIWQIGTVDTLQQTDVDAFAGTVEQGLSAIAERGADAVLLNMQYSPRTDRLIDYASYLDIIRAAAADIRFKMMLLVVMLPVSWAGADRAICTMTSGRRVQPWREARQGLPGPACTRPRNTRSG